MKVFSFLGPYSVVLCVNADTATQKTNNVRPLGTGCENTQTVVSVDPLLPQMCLELCEIISEEEVARRTQTQRYVGTCLSNSEGQKWDGGMGYAVGIRLVLPASQHLWPSFVSPSPDVNNNRSSHERTQVSTIVPL